MARTLTILGGGGWFPAHGRHTARALRPRGSHAILIDAGTGVSRLVESAGAARRDHPARHPAHPLPPRPHRRARVPPGARPLRRHHPVGPRQLALRHRHVRVAQPGVERAVPSRAARGPGHRGARPARRRARARRDRIALRRQDRHSAPTLGMRFEDVLAWITDTAYDPDSARFAAGCRCSPTRRGSLERAAQPRHPLLGRAGGAGRRGGERRRGCCSSTCRRSRADLEPLLRTSRARARGVIDARRPTGCGSTLGTG